MKLTAPTGDTAEFRIKKELLTNGVLLESVVKSNANMDDEVDENGQIWLTIFWDVRIFTKLSKEEVITYSRNFRSLIFGFENIEVDLITVKKLLYDTFINVELDFNQKLPLLPNLKSTDLDITSAKIMEFFVDREIY